MTSLPIFTYTSAQYAKAVEDQLGKGYRHALHLYQQWMQQGRFEGADPLFANAGHLFQDIEALTSRLLPRLLTKVEGTPGDSQTLKFLLKLEDGLETESVLIPMKAGWTLCVSSQIGCRMGCTFCETGKMGLIRNLKAEEIVAQVFAARHLLNYPVRNIVFMGMGEPFDNLDAVLQSVAILADERAFGIGRRHITLSTSGRVDGIYHLIEKGETPPHLAVSIVAPNDPLRSRLMPVNRRWNLQELKEAMQAFCQKFRRSIFIEYALLQGVNDEPCHALELAAYLKNLPAKVNLIPYNPQSLSPFCTPTLQRCEQFAYLLRQEGYRVTLRHSKGAQLMAACGQLGNRFLRRQLRQKEGQEATSQEL
jgi:23S rRNA (adenine2503-C2)-methyltransferase